MGVGIQDSIRYFVGLDLGQSQDHSALAVVERDEILLDEMDHATYERRRARRFRVRFLERLALGTAYPRVVEWCTLVMDATEVGAPVLDLLRVANLACGVVPVNLTRRARVALGRSLECAEGSPDYRAAGDAGEEAVPKLPHSTAHPAIQPAV